MKKIISFLKKFLYLLLAIISLKIIFDFFKNKTIPKDTERPMKEAKESHEKIIKNNKKANNTNTNSDSENKNQFKNDTEGMTESEIKEKELLDPDFIHKEDDELNDILKLSN